MIMAFGILVHVRARINTHRLVVHKDLYLTLLNLADLENYSPLAAEAVGRSHGQKYTPPLLPCTGSSALHPATVQWQHGGLLALILKHRATHAGEQV